MIVFGTGAGRCGTMTLANLLNQEEGVACLHEGKFRDREVPGEQWLPFLTLENLQAYYKPESALTIFREKRGNIRHILQEKNLLGLGDIAYNYAPFVGIIPEMYPDARLVVLVRDGRDFVRSVYTTERPDPTPVGWPDAGAPLTKLEKYISLGRLRPRPDDRLAGKWTDMNPVEKNAWLWAESYRLIMEGLNNWPRKNYLVVSSESFFGDILQCYISIREFLGMGHSRMNDRINDLISTKINRRKNSCLVLPHWTDWDDDTRNDFDRYAGDMMNRLGYY